MFVGGKKAEGQTAAADGNPDDVAAALQYLAAISQATAPAAAPAVVTEYIYVDEPADPPVVTYVTRGATGSAPSSSAAQPTLPAGGPSPEAGESLPPPATPRPAPTAPAAPTSPPAPTATRPAAQQPSGETEFQGTALAVNGDVVTFSRNGGSIDVRVPASVGHVTVGESVKVHAIQLSSGWVAKEIESGE